jgi:hypothetical protein
VQGVRRLLEVLRLINQGKDLRTAIAASAQSREVEYPGVFERLS